jgi:hypothetical protein
MPNGQLITIPDVDIVIPRELAVFARAWSPGRARHELEQIVAKTRGCSVEILMKDISTVNHHPERLREWAEIAMSVVERAA